MPKYAQTGSTLNMIRAQAAMSTGTAIGASSVGRLFSKKVVNPLSRRKCKSPRTYKLHPPV